MRIKEHIHDGNPLNGTASVSLGTYGFLSRCLFQRPWDSKCVCRNVWRDGSAVKIA